MFWPLYDYMHRRNSGSPIVTAAIVVAPTLVHDWSGEVPIGALVYEVLFNAIH